MPQHRIGVAVSTYFFMLDVGTGLGPVVLGAIVQATDYRTMYAVVAAVVALSGGLYHQVHGRRPRVPRPGIGPLDDGGPAAPGPA